MNDIVRFLWICGIVLFCTGRVAGADDRTRQTPVLLTFDVEIEADIAALRDLNPPGSCTLFVTGEFAQAHPDLVRDWSQRHEIACHTMTHPHLPQLDAAKQFAEIRDSAEAIRKATGLFPLGFRAPYLESNDETREALVQLGFRYQSSAWEINHRDKSDATLLEFPISDGRFKDRITVAGDYNLFDSDHMTDEDALTFLLKLYNEHRMSGYPLVILLHPHLAAAHAGVFKKFIERGQQTGAGWTCFRDWLRGAAAVPIKHRAAWVDVDATVYEPEDLVGQARRIGLTDLIVKAYDPYDGALYGPGRENDAFFNGIIDEAHRAGMRVHAWFPICFDPQRLKKHPEWGMVDANGLRSTEWVCPTNTAWRQEFLAIFKDLLDHYGVDGIHFDYIRFPNAEVCQCPACRKELSRRASVAWPLGLELIDQSDTQAAWFDYRSDLIHDLTEEFATAIRKCQEGVIVSAALKPEGAINFDGVKLYGQSYRELAPLLDFVAPMAYHQLEGEPVGWVKAVQLSARWRSGFTPVWHGIQAYEDREHPPMDLGEFGRLLDSMGSGSDGVALFAFGPMLSLVTEAESHANMPQGADELVRRWVLGQKVATTGATAPAARPDVVDVRSRPAGGTATHASDRAMQHNWFWGAFSGAVAIGLLWAVRSRAREPIPIFPELPLSVLDALAAEPNMTGPLAAMIVRRLRQLRPADLDRIRTKSLLSRLREAGGQVSDVDLEVLDPGRLAITQAKDAGWVRDVGLRWCLTPEGRRLLDELVSQNNSEHWDRFIEERLDESLLVTCPTCRTVLAGLWLRPTLGCHSCHHRFPIHQSPAVTIESRAHSAPTGTGYMQASV
jgi:peptidoglycan/xylan/chitin deacetylase (PgdA/CDA1 family)